MMDNQHPGQAPDFTNAAINMLGINLLWIFFVVWMLWGVLPVLMIALLINRFVEHEGDTRGITRAAMSVIGLRVDAFAAAAELVLGTRAARIATHTARVERRAEQPFAG